MVAAIASRGETFDPFDRLAGGATSADRSRATPGTIAGSFVERSPTPGTWIRRIVAGRDHRCERSKIEAPPATPA
jgi:hypothetical protein